MKEEETGEEKKKKRKNVFLYKSFPLLIILFKFLFLKPNESIIIIVIKAQWIKSYRSQSPVNQFLSFSKPSESILIVLKAQWINCYRYQSPVNQLLSLSLFASPYRGAASIMGFAPPPPPPQPCSHVRHHSDGFPNGVTVGAGHKGAVAGHVKYVTDPFTSCTHSEHEQWSMTMWTACSLVRLTPVLVGGLRGESTG